MIDSITIFSKGGLILYQYVSPQQQFQEDEQEGITTEEYLNTFISSILLDPTKNTSKLITETKRAIISGDSITGGGGSGKKNKSNSSKSSSDKNRNVVVEWDDTKDWYVIILYPEILLRGRSVTNVNKSVLWIRTLLNNIIKEYELFAISTKTNNNNKSDEGDSSKLFDKTFHILLKQAEDMGRSEVDDDVENINPNSNKSNQKQHQRVAAAAKKKGSSSGGKEKTVWHDGNAKITKEAMASLDMSKDAASGSTVDGIEAAVADGSQALAEARAAYLPSSDDIPSWEEDDQLNDNDDDDDSSSSSSGGYWGSSIKRIFDQMSGNKVLTEDDLTTPLAEMEKLLTSKNVASDIAIEICNSVKKQLIGKRMASFYRIKTAVRQALETAISKILQPPKDRQVDLLRSVITKREGGTSSIGKLLGSSNNNNNNSRPYVIVMVGINGVGKSTSLAKIAYYLKSNGCNPMLAACDTFRSGAVEQLNVHAKCLDVPLYHKGYAKDPSAVAKAAISHASQENNDVVLVDTAGRMQNNVPLMKALSKLVVENKPDLVLFVCEALVGNDGIDQLSMFNKALRSGGHSRQIDGVVLTKFDTVSDKVGAALTMTHVTGAPIVFVGTGQKYNHLKKLSVQSVIKSLFA